MFFLWKNKPASVLSSSGEWLPKQEIRNRLNEIRIFASAGEARHVQRSKYNKKGVSVLIDKTFKEKAKLQKLPVCKEAATQNPDDCFDGKMPTYGEYLDVLCDGVAGQDSRIIFPSANQELTAHTPLIQEIHETLGRLADFMSKLNGHEQRLSNEIRQIDLLVADRLHQAEIFELTDEESQTFVRELHEAQIERRRRKNELSALMSCKEVLRQVSIDDIKRAINDIEMLGSQKYRCKALSESDPFVQKHVKL